MIKTDISTLRVIFLGRDDSDKEINTDNVYEIINGPAYKDMQCRHFKGIGDFKNERENVFRQLAERFVEYFNSDAYLHFDIWHEEQCRFLHDEFNKLSPSLGKAMTAGKAQKLINITFKHLYLFRNAPEEYFRDCHVTLDSYILDWAKKNDIYSRNTKWSNIGSDEYMSIQRAFKEKLGSIDRFKGMTPFLAEFYIWEEAKPDDMIGEQWVALSKINKWKLLLEDESIKEKFIDADIKVQLNDLISGINDIKRMLSV